MTTDTDDTEIFVGSGNVFADLGLPNPEERLLKAQLTAQIQALLDERGMTDAQAAVALDMPVAAVEQMLVGNLADIPVTHLFKCLNRLGSSVELRVFSKEGSPADAHLTLVMA